MNTEKWTASRVLVIKYDRDGRYHERLFRRTVLNNAFPVYINPAGDRFEKTLLTTYPKAYPIPDDAKLYRWVLKDGTVLTFFCGLAVIVTLAGIWVVNFYPIWMEDSPEPAVFTTQVEKEFGVHDFSCPSDVMSVKDGLPDAGTYRCTITDSKDESAVRDVRLIVTAGNKVGLYDADGKALK